MERVSLKRSILCRVGRNAINQSHVSTSVEYTALSPAATFIPSGRSSSVSRPLSALQRPCMDRVTARAVCPSVCLPDVYSFHHNTYVKRRHSGVCTHKKKISRRLCTNNRHERRYTNKHAADPTSHPIGDHATMDRR